MGIHVKQFQIHTDLPKRGASDALCPHLIHYLLGGDFAAGDAFLSDRELMEATGLSRTTVRRSLSILQRDGWIKRQGGVGTFVGPRLENPGGAKERGHDDEKTLLRSAVVNDAETKPTRRLIRLSVIMAGLKHLTESDWWFGPFLQGIDSVSSKHGIMVEILGNHLTRPDILAQRLADHRPDVFVCFGPPTASEAGMVAIAEVRRRDIPCILSCVQTPELSLPSVHEDAIPGTAAAVKHLYDLGHRRIAFAQVMNTGWWIFDRYQGYRQGLLDCGLSAGEEMSLWLPQVATEQTAAMLKEFLRGKQATAVVLGCQWAAANMQWLTRGGDIRVPDDLSVISLDQKPDVAGWLGGVRPTTVEVPLYEIGQIVGDYARRLSEGVDIPKITTRPNKLVHGDSVRPCDP